MLCCRSVPKSCLTLCDPVDCGTPGLPVLYYLLEFAQTHVHWVSDASRPTHPGLPPSPVLSLSQYQGLSQWVGSLLLVAKVLEHQLQHQSSNEYSGLTSLISLLSEGLSRVFSSTTVWRHQFFSAQPSLLPNSHIRSAFFFLHFLTSWKLG